MTATKVTRNDLEQALRDINVSYKGNIMFRDIKPLNAKHTRWQFTLRVNSSKGLGMKYGPSGRRTVSACWHVHGNFFSELLEIADCKIYTGGHKVTRSGGNWQNWNCGSMMRPMYMSEMCEC